MEFPVEESAKVTYLTGLGLPESKAKEMAKKNDQFVAFTTVLTEANLIGHCDAKQGPLLYQLSSKFKGLEPNRKLIALAVASRKLDSSSRVTAALELASTQGLTEAQLDNHCEVGKVYSEAVILDFVGQVFAKEPPASRAEHEIGKFMGKVTAKLRFADGKDVKRCVDSFLKDKNVADAKPQEKPAKAVKDPQPAQSESKKKKQKEALKTTLAPIDVSIPAYSMAEAIVQMVLQSVKFDEAKKAFQCDEHVTAMVADSLAALQRQSYGAALSAAHVDAKNGIALPPARYPPLADSE